MSVTRIEDSPNCILGEGPHWDVETQSLYYTDIFGKSIHRYVPSSGRHYSAKLDGRVSIIIPVEGVKDQFVVTETNKISKITWDGVSDRISGKELIVELPSDDPNIEQGFNDGKVDPAGRLWVGTMPWSVVTDNNAAKKGAFYNLDSKKKILIKHIDNISISNGLDWIGDKMYYVDSLNSSLGEYLYDKDEGKMTFVQSVFTLEKHNLKGIYDGLTADVDGNLWIARWDEGTIIKVDPRKPETLLETIKLPAVNITSVAFGGPNLDELYVTSAALDVLTKNPTDNCGLYKVTGLGTKGLPMRSVKL